MPRKPKPPELRREPLPPSDPAGAVRAFMEEVHIAAFMFMKSPEAGRRWAVKAATRHVMALFDNNPVACAPYWSLVEMHHPRRSNTDPPDKWLKKVHVAAALDALVPIPGLSNHAAAAAVSGVVKELGVQLEGGRIETSGEARVANLRLNLMAGKGDRGAVQAFKRLRLTYANIGDDLADAHARKNAVLDELRRNLARLRQEPPGGLTRT